MLVNQLILGLLLWAGGNEPVVSPRPLEKKNPSYTRQALDAGIQGTVVLDFEIDEQGRTREVEVLSPLGFGLDEAAVRAVESWRFTPASRGGKAIAVSSRVEVNFQLEGQPYDRKQEQQRTKFNLALAALRTDGSKRRATALDTLKQLVKEKFGPAMYICAVLIREKEVPGDKSEERRLIEEAAKKNYGPAIFETGAWLLNGDGVPRDTDAGLKLVREASVLGSMDAQRALGKFAANGQFGPKNLEDAKRYYRLCAAGGMAVCQEQLGLLLLQADARTERQYLQGIGWLELAAAGGSAVAKSTAEGEAGKLNPAQRAAVDKLKPQLVRRPQ